MNHDTARHKQRIDNLFSKISSLSTDLELQSQWSRYLCILVSGYLEASIRRIYIEYAQNQSNSHVARYVSRQLKFFQNPNMEKILQLIGAFNSDWEEELRDVLNDRIRDSVNSIVANRNLIAHGQDVGISYVSVKQYYEDAVKLVELLYLQCNQAQSLSSLISSSVSP